jgi:hypothetical protein
MSTKEERRARIRKELQNMKIGFCGVKYDHLVWRVSEKSYQVGGKSVSVNNDLMTVDEAVAFID